MILGDTYCAVHQTLQRFLTEEKRAEIHDIVLEIRRTTLYFGRSRLCHVDLFEVV